MPPLSIQENQALHSFFVYSRVKKKEILISNLTMCDKLFFVNHGLLRAFYVNEKEVEITRMIAWENRFLTNMLSFNGAMNNGETIECIEDAEILYINKKNLDRLMNSFSNIKSIYGNILEGYEMQHITRFHQLTVGDVKLKMEMLKTHFPMLINRINDSLLASFLGISRETFVRNKKFL